MHIFCRKRRARAQPGCRGDHSWDLLEWQCDGSQGCRLLVPSTGLWALGLQLLPWSRWSKGAVATAQLPWSYLPVAEQVHRVFASCCVCGSFQQLRFLVTGFPSGWRTEWGLYSTAGGFESRFSLWLWKTTEAFQRADLVLLPPPAPAGVKAAQIDGTELRRMGSWWISGEDVLLPEPCYRALGHRKLNDSHSF